MNGETATRLAFVALLTCPAAAHAQADGTASPALAPVEASSGEDQPETASAEVGADASPITPAEVLDALSAPTISESLRQCALDVPHPGVVKLFMVIHADGSLGLVSTMPALGVDLAKCLALVVGLAAVRESDQETGMMVSVTLGASKKPAAPPPGAVGASPGWKGGDPKPAPAPAIVTLKSSGAALSVVGVLLSAMGGFALAFPLVFSTVDTCGHSGECLDINSGLMALSLLGLVAYGTGVALFTAGAYRKGSAAVHIKGWTQDERLAARFGKAHAMVRGGAAMLIMGLAVTIFPMVYMMATSAHCDHEADDCGGFRPQLLGVLLAGATEAAIATALIAVGSARLTKVQALMGSAHSSAPSIVVAPAIVRGGAGLSLLATF